MGLKFVVMGVVGVVLAATPSAAQGVGGSLRAGAEALNLKNVGELISGQIYGNTSNPSGNGEGVLPSLSPGPWVCSDPKDCAAEPTEPGSSMGDIIAPLVSGGNGKPNFANDKSPGPNFAGQ